MVISMNINDIMVIIFLVSLMAIILEWRMKYPLGTTMVVLCIVPPFIKRIRIYSKKWIGFDSKWRFMLLKDMKDMKENKNMIG